MNQDMEKKLNELIKHELNEAEMYMNVRENHRYTPHSKGIIKDLAIEERSHAEILKNVLESMNGKLNDEVKQLMIKVDEMLKH